MYYQVYVITTVDNNKTNNSRFEKPTLQPLTALKVQITRGELS